MRKMAVYLGLVEDDRYDEGVYVDGPDVADHAEQLAAEPVPARAGSARAGREAHASHVTPAGGPSSVTPMGGRRGPALTPGSSGEAYRITTIHPRTYNEAKQIGETFRDATPVIMNLTEMDDADAKRLVDFAAGLVFGLRGTIERVTNKVFLLSPVNVAVTAEDKARLVERSFFNQS